MSDFEQVKNINTPTKKPPTEEDEISTEEGITRAVFGIVHGLGSVAAGFFVPGAAQALAPIGEIQQSGLHQLFKKKKQPE